MPPDPAGGIFVYVAVGFSPGPRRQGCRRVISPTARDPRAERAAAPGQVTVSVKVSLTVPALSVAVTVRV